MTKHLTENKLFVAALVVSAVLNIGLAYKVHTLQSVSFQSASHRDHVIGTVVNHLVATDLDGTLTSISFAKNDPVTVLYVFRPGCGWCAKNLPNLQAMAASAPSQHFRLIGISLDDHDLKQYVESNNFSFPVYSNVTEDDQARLGMGGTPQTIMIVNGSVAHNWPGAYSLNAKKEIEDTLGIKLPVSID